VTSGTVIVNDDYAVACDQEVTPTVGAAVSTTELYDPPVAAFTPSATEVAVGESVRFDSTSQYADAYRWDFGDGGQSENVEPMHAYWSSGTYTVTLTASNLCSSDQATATIMALHYVYLPLVLRNYR